ncbi:MULTISPECIES: poly-beta-1,6-N-acetyl-D-glucosamine N-deacetylase PgaB [Syntrophotalea]|uniref:Poly-beta-1,6-N-acetyl-D-glucosamine N-deacetylase PgaB C-terminal domain-containing protein n=1 Tax=Syntrophotalea acetylenica TaxID=29542 RepID=A0A1L3GGF4_SYNAC|nr:poly-beta-1,6-N-acetyl-D-glucosamine N-deacetylase PgaB [Syntrophotalea acetylenica]APG25006.1 hypothetical protein A7E75_08240 [Syntrophotalea acetylenica]APG43074.1 hypothetical protein A6070_02200 [Syntrophotalea acetylenica]MDY0261006.1 poly-beta-1,6-N-acetyl-D-glucosamine N-deacetylase PgaB [Syntrophotalea acetylenica]
MRCSRRAVRWMLVAGLLLSTALQCGAAQHIRAAQVSYLASRNFPEVAAEFARMRRMGLDTVILRVFQRPGDRFYAFIEPQAPAGVYFATDGAPVVADALGALTELAHAAGLKVFAWMTTLSTPLSGNEEWKGRRYDPGSGCIIPCEALDPFNPEVHQRLAALFRDLARYPIDGVLLQDDLVLRQTEGFSRAALSASLKDTGRFYLPGELFAETVRGPDGKVRVGRLGPAFSEWAVWKNRHLLGLAEHLRSAAQEVRPGLPFALNLPYEVLTSPRHGLAWFSQDYAQALKSGFEYVAIMAYHRQMSAELSLPVAAAIAKVSELAQAGVRDLLNPAGLLLKLQARDFVSSQDVSPDELRQVVRAVAPAGPVSLAFFPYHSSLGLMPEEMALSWTEEE